MFEGIIIGAVAVGGIWYAVHSENADKQERLERMEAAPVKHVWCEDLNELIIK